LERTWPKEELSKLSSKPRTSHFTTNFKTIVVEYKFEPSSLT
jgi:hypothetical protein